MIFGNWPSEIHEEAEQVKRIESSAGIKATDIALNTDLKTAIITGSATYDVSLSSCTCEDFLRRHLPCKHIYRLANELNLLNDLPTPNQNAAKDFKQSIPSEIERFKTLYKSGAISGKKYVAIVKALESK